jgi:hypothetical protein
LSRYFSDLTSTLYAKRGGKGKERAKKKRAKEEEKKKLGSV